VWVEGVDSEEHHEADNFDGNGDGAAFVAHEAGASFEVVDEGGVELTESFISVPLEEERRRSSALAGSGREGDHGVRTSYVQLGERYAVDRIIR
jgi:hypothetical protein